MAAALCPVNDHSLPRARTSRRPPPSGVDDNIGLVAAPSPDAGSLPCLRMITKPVCVWRRGGGGGRVVHRLAEHDGGKEAPASSSSESTASLDDYFLRHVREHPSFDEGERRGRHQRLAAYPRRGVSARAPAICRGAGRTPAPPCGGAGRRGGSVGLRGAGRSGGCVGAPPLQARLGQPAGRREVGARVLAGRHEVPGVGGSHRQGLALNVRGLGGGWRGEHRSGGVLRLLQCDRTGAIGSCHGRADGAGRRNARGVGFGWAGQRHPQRRPEETGPSEDRPQQPQPARDRLSY
jgi:hypothetical protein